MMKRTTQFYRKNEAEVMKSIGLVPTKNSGAGWKEKEDGQNEFIIAQLKSTDNASIPVKLDDIHTLEYNATVSHKIPLFVIQFLKTHEIFLMVKPVDIGQVAKYLDCGKCDIVKSDVPEINTTTTTTKKVIKSGNRDKFWHDKEKERSKWQKRLKQGH